MKNLLCIVSMLLTNCLFVFSQTKKIDVYDFPIQPKTEAWEQIETVVERIALLQIPDVVLEKISTEGLLETCLQYPYLINIYFRDNYQQGVEGLMAEFNGFRELFKRSDLTNALMKQYENIAEDVKGIRLLYIGAQGAISFRHFVLGMMLTQDAVFKNLSMEQEERLFLMHFEHKRIRKDYSDIFGGMHDISTNLLYAKKITSDPNVTFENTELRNALLDFVQSPGIMNQSISDYLENYINIKYKK